MELSPFFRSIEILSDLTDEEIALLSSSEQLLDYPLHAKIITLGEIGRCLWIVYDGEVEVSIPEADGDSRVIASLERGAIFGDPSGNLLQAACRQPENPREIHPADHEATIGERAG
jgi:CRP-like cAMP-binding protein